MWERLKSAVQELARAWGRYECSSLAAGIAFYSALSLFPLMLALIAGVGYFFRFVERGQDAREEILATVSQQISPAVGEALEKVLAQVQQGSLVNGPIAGFTFLLTASLVFAQIDRGFVRIWDVRRRRGHSGAKYVIKSILLNRARSLVLLLGTMLLVVLVFIAGLALRAVTGIMREWFPEVPTISGFGTLLIGLAVNVMVFALVYRFLSKEKVGFRLCLRAALLAALLWEAGSWLMTLLSFGGNYSAYGLIGSFLLVLVWIDYNVMVLFLGALVVRLATRPLDDSGAAAGAQADSAGGSTG